MNEFVAGDVFTSPARNLLLLATLALTGTSSLSTVAAEADLPPRIKAYYTWLPVDDHERVAFEFGQGN